MANMLIYFSLTYYRLYIYIYYKDVRIQIITI